MKLKLKTYRSEAAIFLLLSFNPFNARDKVFTVNVNVRLRSSK
jgi:hypothetical protein